MSERSEQVYEKVRERYGRAATATKAGGNCCSQSYIVEPSTPGAGCCGPQVPDLVGPALGCGNPLPRAALKPGETVLDIGSGAGAEVIAASRAVLPDGVACGLDMTDEMLALALANKRAAAAHNAIFIKGKMENIPLPDESVDVIISNCVINLSPDKPQALTELYRVLRKGGRLAIQDTVCEGQIPEDLKNDTSSWCECVSGSMSLDEYRQNLVDAGFDDISFTVDGWYDQEATTKRGFRIGSAFVSAFRPGGESPKVEKAMPQDLAAIKELLLASDLPTEGVDEQLGNFLVIREGEKLTGCIGTELYGEQALLRSACVAESKRGSGLGSLLTQASIEYAKASGAAELYLLTTTADKYFEKHGFYRIPREAVAGPVLGSVEFESVCPVSAVVMAMNLEPC